MPNLKPNLEQTKSFLEMLSPNENTFFFAAYHDSDRSKPGHTYVGTLDQHWQKLQKLNQRGYGIFFTVQSMRGHERGNDEVKFVRALFVDDDSGTVDGSAYLPPHITVKSSGNKRHYYWLTDDISPQEFKELSDPWVKQHEGADQIAKDLARLLRLPGFYHMKGNPELVEVIHERSFLPNYTYNDFKNLLPLPEEEQPLLIKALKNEKYMTEVKSALSAIPAEAYDEWIKVGMALKHNFGDAAFDLWEEWSSTGSTFKVGECKKKWKSFKRKPDGEAVTTNTILHIAREHGYKGKPTDKTDITWPKLKALPSERPITQAMQPEDLPPFIREWCQDIAERMQVPLEMVAAPALVCFSSAVARSYSIHPKAYDSWLVIPNLWGAVVARASEMKTPVLRAVSQPLRELASSKFEAALLQSQAAERDIERLDIQIEQVKSAYKKATNEAQENDFMAKLSALMDDKEQIKPKMPRFVVNDTTPEKLADLFAENPKGLLMIRDELAGWFEEFRKPGHEGSRQFYLECWNGGGEQYIDRIKRGSQLVQNMTLSAVGSIQPGVISQHVRNAIGNSKYADGLMQRFQLLVWPEMNKDFKVIDRKPNEAVELAVENIFSRLIDTEPQEALRFSEEAQTVFYEWLEVWGKTLKKMPDKTHAHMSHLAKYNSMIPSLALIFEVITSPVPPKEVGIEALQYALKWQEILLSHSKKLYAAELQSGVAEALLLANKIENERLLDGETVREIHRKRWSGLTSADGVEEGLKILESLHWIKIEKVQQPKGGQPSRVVCINPQCVNNVLSVLAA